MSDITKYKINRYSLDKEYIMTGEITVTEDGPLTELLYKDTELEETASDRGLPMVALIVLREKLETKHKSILAINGSRIDTTLRPTGGDIAYVIRDNIIAEDDWVGIFEPTTELEKLCTVQQHEKAYDEWCDAVCPKENFG
jgi:hypothetical protein